MAKTQPVDGESIDLLVKMKDAGLLARYAKENGADAFPFLQEAWAFGEPARRTSISAPTKGFFDPAIRSIRARCPS